MIGVVSRNGRSRCAVGPDAEESLSTPSLLSLSLPPLPLSRVHTHGEGMLGNCLFSLTAFALAHVTCVTCAARQPNRVASPRASNVNGWALIS